MARSVRRAQHKKVYNSGISGFGRLPHIVYRNEIRTEIVSILSDFGLLARGQQFLFPALFLLDPTDLRLLDLGFEKNLQLIFVEKGLHFRG